MAEKKAELERLCKVYEELNEVEKEEVIKYAEGLLSSLEADSNENAKLKFQKSGVKNQ